MHRPILQYRLPSRLGNHEVRSVAWCCDGVRFAVTGGDLAVFVFALDDVGSGHAGVCAVFALPLA